MSAGPLDGGYLLDTNVLSELMREAPAPEVLHWHVGRPIEAVEAQVAAVALAAHLKLVTRNAKDFAGIDSLEVINLWQPH
jgi:predicted nucleic acid-binding protein